MLSIYVVRHRDKSLKVKDLIICLMICLISLSALWYASISKVTPNPVVRHRFESFQVMDLIMFLMIYLIILGADWYAGLI